MTKTLNRIRKSTAVIRAMAENKTENSALEQEVLDTILAHSQDGYTAKTWLEHLMQHGCISGMVGELIYYNDTHEFFDKHYDEITTMLEEYEEEYGSALQYNGDMKNFYAWFAFEEVARKFYNQVEDAE